MAWEEFKKKKENELRKRIKENKIDLLIINLLNIINRNSEWVSTSSCSGRIVLLSTQKGKEDAEFYRKWHREVKPKEVEASVKEYRGKKMLWFRCEPFILHIAAKNIESANEFLKKVREKGVKRGGIQTITDNKVMIEIQGNGWVVFPLDSVEVDWNKFVGLSNKILNRNFKHLEVLEKVLKE